MEGYMDELEIEYPRAILPDVSMAILGIHL
jgi:hypothetical protein